MNKPDITTNQNNVGFVIGNGRSRLEYNLEDLKKYGLIYGCNALYRDFTPDVLVSVDDRMIMEILEFDYKGLFYYVGRGTRMFFSNKTHPHNYQKQRDGIHLSFGWASGSSALRLLCELNPCISIVNMIGFDLYGIDGKVNNVYVDTQNYVDSNSNETESENWIKQMKEVFLMFKDIMFYRVGNIEDTFPVEWRGLKNIKFVEEMILT
jgi:hypothetical protein